MICGRYFNERHNHATSRAIVIDEEQARRFWPDGDAIGRRMFRPTRDVGYTIRSDRERTAIVRDLTAAAVNRRVTDTSSDNSDSARGLMPMRLAASRLAVDTSSARRIVSHSTHSRFSWSLSDGRRAAGARDAA